MHISIDIVDTPIERPQMHDSPPSIGAVIEFYGVVREMENGEKISGIKYEAFREMAEHQLQIIASTLTERYDLVEVTCIHRIGFVPVGEPSLYVRVASSHRAEAFQAVMGFIDELKRVVPIWKHALP